jgi:hypothetical protein
MGGSGAGIRAVWNRDLPDEPEEAFGGSVFSGLQFIEDEFLEGFGLEGSGELAFTDFLGRVLAG